MAGSKNVSIQDGNEEKFKVVAKVEKEKGSSFSAWVNKLVNSYKIK